MLKLGVRLLALAATAVLFTNAAPIPAFTIWSPRQVNAAFVQPNGTFVAEVAAVSTASTTGWTATLQNDLQTWPATVVSATWGKIKHNTLDGWHITIRVPSGTPPELFQLNLAHSTGGAASSHHAVSVVPTLESNFYVLQLTDEHVRTQTAPGSDGYRSAELVGWAAPVVNLINPRFVLNSGDDTDSMAWSDSPNQFPWYKAARAGYRVGCVTVPGNHDVAATGNSRHAVTTSRWDSEMGYRTFSTKLGSFYVLAHDFHDSKLKTWAATEWGRSFTDPSIKYRLLTQHFTGVNYFSPASGSYPNLMLLGHLHYNLTSQTTPYPILVNVAALSYARAGYHEFRKTSTGGWTNTSATGHEGGANQIQLVGSWGAPRVRAAYAKANDGTQTSNSVSITNDLGKTFYDGRVRFLMAAGSYTLTGAQEIAEYSYGGTKKAVIAKVSIVNNGITKVSIAPTSTTTTLTTSFQNGVLPGSTYAGTADTTLSQAAPTVNYGAAATILVDGDDPGGSGKDLSTLIRWDVSPIPPGSSVRSATMKFNVVNVSPLTYEVYEMKRAWVESQATWNQYATGLPWQTAGALGTSDRGSTALGTLTGSTTGAHTITLNAAGLALLQTWVNTPSSNRGVVISDGSNSDGTDLSSSESATAALRPQLTVTYTPPATSSTTLAATAIAPPEALFEPLPEVKDDEPIVDAGSELAPPADASPSTAGEGSDGMKCGLTGLESLLFVSLAAALRRRKAAGR
jgi:hypothetical protein